MWSLAHACCFSLLSLSLHFIPLSLPLPLSLFPSFPLSLSQAIIINGKSAFIGQCGACYHTSFDTAQGYCSNTPFHPESHSNDITCDGGVATIVRPLMHYSCHEYQNKPTYHSSVKNVALTTLFPKIEHQYILFIDPSNSSLIQYILCKTNTHCCDCSIVRSSKPALMKN